MYSPEQPRPERSDPELPHPDADAEVPAPTPSQGAGPPAASPLAPAPLANQALTDPALAEGDPAAGTLEERVIVALKTVFDPEIPVNIYELGLVYGIQADEDSGKVAIQMTLTSPACPVAGTLPGEVEMRVKGAHGVTDCAVDLVWDPPWSMEKLSEEARLQMGLH